MRTLLLLRHAKSSWKQPDLADHDRPLNGRGRRDAPRMGRLIAAERLGPEMIACSTAERARQTALLMTEAGALDAPIVFTEALYHASPSEMTEVLAGMPDEIGVAMVIGHNPGLEALIRVLTDTHETMPTAALCQLELDIADWCELSASTTGFVVNVWRPKELL